MHTPASTDRYKNHRFPTAIISHGVWLSYRFCLSSRDVEDLLFVRGVTVTYEAIRKWCGKFGQQYANQLRRRRSRPGDTWHLDVRRVIDTEECKSLPGLWEGPVLKKTPKSFAVDRLPNIAPFTMNRSELVQRLNAARCEYCGKDRGSFEVHHVRRLRDTQGKELWQQMMAAMRRKTLVLCVACHDQLHTGTLPPREITSA